MKIPAGGKGTIKLEGLLTLDQQLLIKTLSRLAKIVVHESYHIGQLGALRRSVGKAGAIRPAPPARAVQP